MERGRVRALAAGAAGVIIALILGFIDSRKAGAYGWQDFLRSYVFAYAYWVSIPLGCLALLMLHHCTSGWWGFPIRRIFEAGSRTIWFMAVLFIPILIGMSRIYPWTQPGEIPDDPVNHFKRAYLQPGAFTVRTVVYFACWIVLAYLLNQWSAQQDRTGDLILKDRMVSLSAPGLVLWSLTVTGASIDWVLSLEPHWFSTIYGMIFIVVECLAGLTFAILVLAKLWNYEPLKDSVEPKRLIDLGSLMLTFTILWAYVSFSQFLIIWSGNLKNEIPWYMVRAFGRWGVVAAILLLFHFFVPFFLLLQRRIKRRVRTLSMVAWILLVVSLMDVYWLVVPAYEQAGPRLHLLDIFAVIGIGGLWIAMFLAELKKLPLLPLHDPRFEGVAAVMEHQHGD
jgi:hypothetical protein